MRDHRHLLLVLLLHRPQSLPTRRCPLGSEGWRFQMGQQLPEALLQMHPSHLQQTFRRQTHTAVARKHLSAQNLGDRIQQGESSSPVWGDTAGWLANGSVGS